MSDHPSGPPIVHPLERVGSTTMDCQMIGKQQLPSLHVATSYQKGGYGEEKQSYCLHPNKHFFLSFFFFPFFFFFKSSDFFYNVSYTRKIYKYNSFHLQYTYAYECDNPYNISLSFRLYHCHYINHKFLIFRIKVSLGIY